MQYETKQIDLLDYETWIGKSAGDVLHVIKEKKGWPKAYPIGTKIPMWLSRVRNYFNECPKTITQLGSIEATNLKSRIPAGKYGSFSAVTHVYKDEVGRHWFQTPSAGTIYHSSGDPNSLKKAKNIVGGQRVTETFKLLHFDGTDGSSELILLNHAAWIAHNSGGNFVSRFIQRKVHGGGHASVKKVGEVVNVRGLIIESEQYASSYNFGDFYQSSEEVHGRFDVATHSVQSNFYVKVNPSLKLEDRIFPKAWAGIDIAESDSHFKYGH